MLESAADHAVHCWQNATDVNCAGVINSTNASSQRPPDKVFTFISGVLILICLLIGVLGNLWIVVTVLVRREMRGNLINLFITSLCLNDLLNLLLNQTMVAVSYLAHGWVLSRTMCDFMPEFNMVLVCVSLWHHALIALHRYIVVVHNNTYIALHKGLYSAIMLLGTRLLAALLSLSYPLLNSWKWANMTVYQEKMLRCIYEHTQRKRILGIVLLTQFLPCIIIIVCFALIFMFVHRTGRRSSAADRLLLKREIKITKMFGAVFVMFLVGFLPYGFLRMFDSDNRLSPNAYVVVTLLYAIASCVNPVIFGAMNRDIRVACLQLVPAACRKDQNARVQASNGASRCRRSQGITVCISMQQRNKTGQDQDQDTPIDCLHDHSDQPLNARQHFAIEPTNLDSTNEEVNNCSTPSETSGAEADNNRTATAAVVTVFVDLYEPHADAELPIDDCT